MTYALALVKSQYAVEANLRLRNDAINNAGKMYFKVHLFPQLVLKQVTRIFIIHNETNIRHEIFRISADFCFFPDPRIFSAFFKILLLLYYIFFFK